MTFTLDSAGNVSAGTVSASNVSGGNVTGGTGGFTTAVRNGIALIASETDSNTSDIPIGVVGSTPNALIGIGVRGLSGLSSHLGAGADLAGVWGDSGTAGGRGVIGIADDGSGVGAFSNSGTDTSMPTLEATNFSTTSGALVLELVGGAGGDCTVDGGGNLSCTGSISAPTLVATTTKDFKVDDPLDPGNKYLVHATVESSELMNMYTGNAILDASGAATVQLPVWFQAENGDFRYQLTSIGASAPGLYVAEEISGNEFKIAGGKPGGKVSWQVTGLRQDAPAKANPLVVEQEKAAADRGRYLHPELYGAPETQRIGYVPPRPMIHRLPAAALSKLNRSPAAVKP